MKLLNAVPAQMVGRGHPNSVPIECECKTVLLWERRKGTLVRCPHCKAEKDVPQIAWKGSA